MESECLSRLLFFPCNLMYGCQIKFFLALDEAPQQPFFPCLRMTQGSKRYIRCSTPRHSNDMAIMTEHTMPHILLCDEITKYVQSSWMAKDQIMSFDVFHFPQYFSSVRKMTKSFIRTENTCHINRTFFSTRTLNSTTRLCYTEMGHWIIISSILFSNKPFHHFSCNRKILEKMDNIKTHFFVICHSRRSAMKISILTQSAKSFFRSQPLDSF